LSYQWFFNNAAIANATSATLTLTNVQTLNSGNYTVRVTNSLGFAFSAIAGLSVTVPPAVTIVASDPSAAEAALDPGAFTISRTGSTGAPLTVQFTVAGSANAGSDYVALVSPVTIKAGAASTNVTVTPINDLIPEAAETVIVTLSPGSDYAVGSPG